MGKIIFIIVSIFLLTCKSNSQTGWQVLNSGVTVNLYGLYFQNLNTGYVCGAGGTILKTTNAGLNWNPLSSSVSYQLYDICFTNNVTGYCAGSSGIIKTTNSGMNWFSVYNTQIFKICNAGSIIYAGGDNGIYKSIDSGQTWITALSYPGYSIKGLFFNNINTGYGMGIDGLQRKTTNGGLNWMVGGFWGPGTYNFGECYFFNSDTGFAGYSYNSGYPNYYTSYGIYKATYWGSGGSSWIEVYSSSNKGIGGMIFKGRDTGYAVGGGWTGSQYESLILKTINGGDNWTPQNFVTDQVLQDVFFIDSKRGYAVGRSGIILKTETGGVVEICSISNTTPEEFSLYQNYPNPFNPLTNIKFAIPKSASVKISVFDVSGKEIEVLVNEKLQAGIYETNWNASKCSSGIYFCKIITGDFSETKKMLLIK